MNEPCDSVNDDKKMLSLAVKKIRDKTFVNEIEEKKERIPLHEDSIGSTNESNTLREDSISYRNESIPLCEECIGNSKKMCIPVSKDCIGNKKLKLGFGKECTTVVAALNPANENRLKLKQGNFEQGRVLDHVAQTPLILASMYSTHDSVSHGSETHSNAQSHNENSQH